MLLNDRVKKQVQQRFEQLEGEVKLIVFTQELECDFCRDTREIAEELAGLSDKVRLEIYDFVNDKAVAEEYGIDKIPAIAVVGERDYGIRYFGLPGGYEFSSLLETVQMVSTGKADITDDTKVFLDGLQQDLHLQVFVTPTCPYCPRAVVLAHTLAVASDRVRADMVEISEFPQLGVKYQVQGVPRTVINETIVQEGAAPEQVLIQKLQQELR